MHQKLFEKLMNPLDGTPRLQHTTPTHWHPYTTVSYDPPNARTGIADSI